MNTITKKQEESLEGMTLEELAVILGKSKRALMEHYGQTDTAVAGAAHEVRQLIASGAIKVE